MKKLFTLALALLIASVGFSQVQKVSRKDIKQNVATMQKAPRVEAANEFAESQPTMTSTRGDGELDITTYDWQTNCGKITRTIVWPDGKVSFGYTIASTDNFSDRGTGIGTYDPATDTWTPMEGRVEAEKTGFGSIARYKDNGIVVASHNASTVGLFIIEDKDNITPNSVAAVNYIPDNGIEPTWANVMTSGANRDIIHLVYTSYSQDGNPMYYARTSDGGETWDKLDVVIPYLSDEYFTDWGANIAYWMETTEDNCLALVVNNAWSDGMVIYSYDNGETWNRKVYYHHPDIHYTYDSDNGEIFFYPRWTSAQWGPDGKLRIAYEWNGSTGEPGSGSYYPGLGGVNYWSETMPYHGETAPEYGSDPNNPMPLTPGQPFIIDTAYLYEDIYASFWYWSDANHDMFPECVGYLNALTDDGDWENPEDVTEWNISISDGTASNHGSYNCGPTAMPTICIAPNTNGNGMVIVWSSIDENNIDSETGNFYFKLFAVYTNDGGNTWSNPVHLTNDFMWAYSEFVYTQAVIVNDMLVVASMSDNGSGSYVQNEDNEPMDNYYQGFAWPLTEIFPEYDAVEETVSHNVQMSIYPNPAVDQLNVNLNQSADIAIYNIMGQNVMNVQGHVGANSINISSLTSGIYFVNAGSEVQKFIVK